MVVMPFIAPFFKWLFYTYPSLADQLVKPLRFSKLF
jgi:hypothetical protein